MLSICHLQNEHLPSLFATPKNKEAPKLFIISGFGAFVEVPGVPQETLHIFTNCLIYVKLNTIYQQVTKLKSKQNRSLV
jgi:hypothetical protein